MLAPCFHAAGRTEAGKLRCLKQFVAQRVRRKSAALHPLLQSFEGNSQRLREVLLPYESSLCKPPNAKGLRERCTTRIFRRARFGISFQEVSARLLTAEFCGAFLPKVNQILDSEKGALTPE